MWECSECGGELTAWFICKKCDEPFDEMGNPIWEDEMEPIKDWAYEAAKEIRQWHIAHVNSEEILDAGDMTQIIKKHCPFKPDTAYEEVGEVSRKLDQIFEMVKHIRSNQ